MVAALFGGVSAVAPDRNGSVVLDGFGRSRLRRVSPDGTFTTVAGSDSAGFAYGALGVLNTPSNGAIEPTGAIMFGDQKNHVVGRISPSRAVSTIARLLSVAASGRRSSGPRIVSRQDGLGNVFVSESDRHRVLQIFVIRRVRSNTNTTIPLM